QAAHVAPDEPRGIQEWDGHQWTPAGVAKDREARVRVAGSGRFGPGGQRVRNRRGTPVRFTYG
ncbi:DUF6087 family protein, partial [Streptomyces hirsutus]|uniref:DUF6087 family protein n=1 Tax=Streptomyces hirsutus TaxID=35620 RepID=UPI0033284C24